MIEKTFTPTKEMYFKAFLETFHAKKISRYYYGFFVVLPVVLSLLLLGLRMVNAHIGASGEAVWKFADWEYLLLTVVVSLVLIPLFVWWKIRSSFRTNPSLAQPKHWQFDPKNIRTFSQGVDTTFEWSKVVRLKRGRHFLLIFFSKHAAFFVPIGLFSKQELEKIEAWYRQKH